MDHDQFIKALGNRLTRSSTPHRRSRCRSDLRFPFVQNLILSRDDERMKNVIQRWRWLSSAKTSAPSVFDSAFHPVQNLFAKRFVSAFNPGVPGITTSRAV
jgi:hypothetical protein